MSELKPCPFCGSEDIWCGSYDVVPKRAGRPVYNFLYAVKCKKCEMGRDFFSWEKDAVNAWNRRAI